MGKQSRIVTSAQVTRRFVCGACEASAEVAVHARGASAWQNEGFFDPDPSGKDALRAATLDLASDAGRILSLVRCPACGHRSRVGVLRSFVRYLIPLGAAIVVGFLFTAVAPDEHRVLIACLAFPICMAIAALDEVRRWREAARCVKGARTVAPVPKAIARTAPPRAPLAPIASSAPEQVTPAAPEDGPSFLR